ncbi:MAG: GNAT family N-acetyltransferase, partial [Myxococcota bacterium]
WVEVTDRNLALRGYGMATVTWAETGAAIGFCGLVHPDGQPEAELKYAFARDWWGRGLATEVAAGVLRYGVEQLGLRAVIATVAPGNAASRRVLEKVGLVRRADRIHDDGTATIVYGTAG